MRILIATESMGHSGGIETYLSALGRELFERGHTLGWLFGGSPHHGQSIADGVAVHIWKTNPVDAASTRAQILTWQPDVVFANGLHDAAWDSWLADNFITSFFAHGYFGTCISGRKSNVTEGVTACRRTLGPACLLHYFPKQCGGRNPARMFSDYQRERLRQANLTKFMAVIVASKYMMNEYLRHGVSNDRLHCISLFPTGVVPDPTTPAKRSHWSNRVVMVGRLTALKGTSVACEAVAIASQLLGRSLTLVVLGEGPGNQDLVRDAQRFHTSIELRGWVGPEIRNAQLRTADVLLVPSLWPEPFGLIGVEAGSVGLPAVAFDVGGIRDWLQAEESGELVSTSSHTAAFLGEALAKVLSSFDYHHKLSRGAWARANDFKIDRHVDQLVSLFSSLTRNR